MICARDTSALVRRYVADGHRPLVEAALADAEVWCVSDLAGLETRLALHRLSPDPWTLAAATAAFHADWATVHVVPVDGRCQARAAELGATYGRRATDAVHLAAADRLPRPVRYVTFERRQLPAASALELEVVSPLAE